MNTAKAEKIKTLRDHAKFYRSEIAKGGGIPGFAPWQLGIVARRLETSARLFETDIRSREASNAIREAIREFTEFSAESVSDDASASIELETRHLRIIEEFLFGRRELSFADNIYTAFAEARYRASYPDGLPEDFDRFSNLSIGIKILARAHPEWVRFVFSVFPYEKTLKPLSSEDISRGLMSRIRPDKGLIYLTCCLQDPKKYSLPNRLAIDEAAIFIAKAYENLMFRTFLNGFFVYPIFTGLCFPFEADFTEAIEKMGPAKASVRSICTEHKDENALGATSADYFNVLRALLRQADTALHVGFHYRSRLISGRGNPHDNRYIWADNLGKGQSFATVAEEMLSFSDVFELTGIGQAYVMAEENFLEGLRTGLEASREDLKNF